MKAATLCHDLQNRRSSKVLAVEELQWMINDTLMFRNSSFSFCPFHVSFHFKSGKVDMRASGEVGSTVSP